MLELWIFSVIQFVWILIMSFALIYKACGTELIDIVKHFTNWSWVLQIIFYSLTLVGYYWQAVYDSTINALFFMVNGTVWLVFAIIIYMVLHNSRVITQYFEQYDAGIVIAGNTLFHTATVIFLLLFIIVNREYIARSISRAIGAKDSFLLRYCIFMYQCYFSTVLFTFAYLLFFDPRRVYSFDVNLFGPAAVVIFVLTLVNLIPYTLIVYGNQITDLFHFQGQVHC